MTTLLKLSWIFLSALPASAGEPVQPTDCFPPPESQGGWRTLTPQNGAPNTEHKRKIREIAAVDWDKLEEAWKHNLQADGPSVLLVIRRGTSLTSGTSDKISKMFSLSTAEALTVATWIRRHAALNYFSDRIHFSSAFVPSALRISART